MTVCENIPEELKKLNQWVCANSNSKVPMQACISEAASSTNKQTWASFNTAYDAVLTGFYDYCGFVFADNGYVGIDIDTGCDEDGLMTTLAADIIGTCKSYTEKSKSGRGFHILLRGDIPFKGRNNLSGVEIYKTARYFIMTGDVVLYRTIREGQEAIDYVLEKYFSEIKHRNKTSKFSERVYQPVWELPMNHRVPLRPTYPMIPDGCRNLSLTSMAGALHSYGYGKKQIYEDLLYVNHTACHPPLAKAELKSICNSVTRYER